MPCYYQQITSHPPFVHYFPYDKSPLDMNRVNQYTKSLLFLCLFLNRKTVTERQCCNANKAGLLLIKKRQTNLAQLVLCYSNVIHLIKILQRIIEIYQVTKLVLLESAHAGKKDSLMHLKLLPYCTYPSHTEKKGYIDLGRDFVYRYQQHMTEYMWVCS